MPSDPTAAVVIRYLKARHREYVKPLEGLDETGLNWRPGTETNSIYEILTHALDGERQLLTAIAGNRIPPDTHFNVRGTVAEALERIQRADADLQTYASQFQTDDMGKDVHVLNRTIPAVLALYIAIGHTTEHMAHIQLTRQMWDQYGKSGVIKGIDAVEGA